LTFGGVVEYIFSPVFKYINYKNMSERGPERHDERPSFSPAATVVFAGIAAATVTMTASSVRQHGFRNAPGFNDVQGRVDNAPVERSPFGIQNPKKGSPVVQEQMGVVSGRVQSVSNDTVVNGESMVLDSGSRVSDGGNYGRNGGVKSLPEMKRGAGVKRSVKVPGLSRDADSKVSVVEAVRAKLDRRGKNLAALSEYQLQGIVHGAVEDVLKSGRLPLRSGITVRTFPDKLSEYRVDRLGLDGRIRDAIGEVSAGKKERRDEMKHDARKILAKDSGLNVSDDEIGSVSYADVEEKEAIALAEREAHDRGYVEWIEGLNKGGFDSKDVPEMSAEEFGALFEEHFAETGATPDAVAKGMVPNDVASSPEDADVEIIPDSRTWAQQAEA